MSAAADVTERVRRLASHLEDTDLEPHPAVNAAFSELVGLALHHRGAVAEQVIAALGPDLDRVRRLCALGESALERHWSARVAAAADSWAELTCFPYARNYEGMVDLELAVVRGFGVAVRRVAVVGSGPLPMTGVVLAGRHDLDVVLVDRDPDALRAGDGVVRALGLHRRASSVLADVGRDPLDLRSVDLVVFGALVGSDGVEKRAMLADIGAAATSGSHVLIRSAAALRELLYPPVSLDGVAGLTSLLEVHPHDDIVNSILLARRN
ncbi:MAG: nicotianamine synthase family protein [Nocardioidaceae bacterium]